MVTIISSYKRNMRYVALGKYDGEDLYHIIFGTSRGFPKPQFVFLQHIITKRKKLNEFRPVYFENPNTISKVVPGRWENMEKLTWIDHHAEFIMKAVKVYVPDLNKKGTVPAGIYPYLFRDMAHNLEDIEIEMRTSK